MRALSEDVMIPSLKLWVMTAPLFDAAAAYLQCSWLGLAQRVLDQSLYEIWLPQLVQEHEVLGQDLVQIWHPANLHDWSITYVAGKLLEASYM